MPLTDDRIRQHVHTLRFAGLTPSQETALNALVKAFEAQREAAKPFGVLAERYLEYRHQHSDLSRRYVLDFTAWLDQRGEDPDVLFGQFKAVADGST